MTRDDIIEKLNNVYNIDMTYLNYIDLTEFTLIFSDGEEAEKFYTAEHGIENSPFHIQTKSWPSIYRVKNRPCTVIICRKR